MTDKELGYIAGIIDGEGCIWIAKNYNIQGHLNYGVRLQVRMCNREVIKRIKELVGTGNIYYSKSTNHKHRDSYTWIICGKKAISLLQLIYPLLIEKKEQALLAIEFQNRFLPQPGKRIPKEINNLRAEFYETMKSLK